MVVVGYGCIKVGKYPDESEASLAFNVVTLALEDTGITKEDIEGIKDYLTLCSFKESSE